VIASKRSRSVYCLRHPLVLIDLILPVLLDNFYLQPLS
jgi:hypothetical protein